MSYWYARMRCVGVNFLLFSFKYIKIAQPQEMLIIRPLSLKISELLPIYLC